MADHGTIASAVLVGLYDSVLEAGLDPLAVGRDCGLEPGVWFDGGDEVPLARFVRVLEALACQSGDRGFGRRAGRHFDLRFLGDLGRAMIAAPNLGAALGLLADCLELVQTVTEIRFRVEGEEAVLAYRILDPDIWPRCQDAEFTLSIVEQLVRASVPEPGYRVGLSFEHDQGRGPGRFNAMSFPARFLDRPIGTEPGRCWSDRSRKLRLEMVARNRARPVAARTETAILRRLGAAKPCQQAIAEDLGTSPRSLHRRLRGEGTTFSAVLADCRIRLGRHLLAHGDAPLGQIALDLGFGDQSCLSRAFKAAVGMSPQCYRRQAGRGDP